MSELLERFGRWKTREDRMLEVEARATFALDSDRNLVCLEEDGRWFRIVFDVVYFTPDEGRYTRYVLEDQFGHREDAVIEPIWVAGYFDEFEER